jgi:hypothetical protein
MDGKPYVSPTQHAIIDSIAVADQLRNVTLPSSLSDSTQQAVPIQEELTTLVDAFAAIPDQIEHEQPDDPNTYSEAMASEHAIEWTSALKEEFDSLQELGIY